MIYLPNLHVCTLDKDVNLACVRLNLRKTPRLCEELKNVQKANQLKLCTLIEHPTRFSG
jgi:hypothetical protein